MIRVGNYTIDESVQNILYRVKSELTNGKLKTIRRRGGQVVITCPFHDRGQESDASCYINDEGIFNCFACHESGRFSKLIGACFDADEKYGRNWLLSHYVGNQIIYDDADKPFNMTFTKNQKREYLDESILDNYEDWHPYLEKRHLSKDICKLFKVKYDPETKMIVFPVYDEHNKLYMLTRRSVESKQFLIDKNKEKPVYLLNYIIRKGITEVTVCESQINALTCYSFGYPAVAMFGTGTDHQYKILNRSGIRHYYLAFDGDEAGRKATRKFIENCRKDVLIDVLEIPEGKDVNDLTEDEFIKLKITNSFEWLMSHKK